jgi:hypothetical protein
MKARRIATASVLAVLLAGAAHAAEGVGGRVAIAAQVGTQSELGGDLVSGGQGTLAGLDATFNSVKYKNVYAPKVRLQGFIGYGVANRVEIVLRGGYYKSTGTGVSAGTLAGKDLFAFFTDYEEGSAEVAGRFYVAWRPRLKSWIAPVAGLRWSKSIYASYSIPDAGSAVLNVPFSKKSTVPVLGLDLGVSFDLTENLFVGIDSGLRWQGAPADANALSSLPTIDDSTGRWTAPVMASLGVRF